MPDLLVFPTSSIATGTSLETYRRPIAQRIGLFWRGVTTAQATGLEAARYVICDGFKSDVALPDHFDHLYLYVRNGAQAGTQRKIVPGGYQGADGALALDYPLAGALATNVQVEVAAVPAVDYLGMTGLNTNINDALRGLWLRDRLVFEGDGTESVSLIDYDWLLGTDQIIGLVDTLGVPTGGNPVLAATPWRIRYNGDTRYLETDVAYADGTEFQVEVYRPANTLIKVNGTWGSGSGLTGETDEAIPPPYMVTALALALTYEQLAARAEWDERLRPSAPRFERELRRWGRAAVRIKWEALPHEANPYPLVSGQSGYAWGTKGIWP